MYRMVLKKKEISLYNSALMGEKNNDKITKDRIFESHRQENGESTSKSIQHFVESSFTDRGIICQSQVRF